MSPSNLIVIALLALLVCWTVGAYNRLIRLKNAIANAFGQLDGQLKRRYDLIPHLAKAAEKYPQQEQEQVWTALAAVTAARNQARAASDAARSRPANALAVITLGSAEQALGSSLGLFFAAVATHPELETDQSMRTLSEALTGSDSKVRFARQTFNEAVRTYNHAQGEFPAVLVARLFGFAPAALLQASESLAERRA